MNEKSTVRARIGHARIDCPVCGKSVRLKQGGVIGSHGFSRKADGTIDLSSKCRASGKKHSVPTNRVFACSKCGSPVTSAQDRADHDEEILCPLCLMDIDA